MAATRELPGREAEIDRIVNARSSGRTRICCITADSGFGKSAVAKDAFGKILSNEPGPSIVWSNYNSAHGDYSVGKNPPDLLDGYDASLADRFIQQALIKFDVTVPNNASNEEKGQHLAAAFIQKNGLMLIDGFERQQVTANGSNMAPESLKIFLESLARHPKDTKALCILTTTKDPTHDFFSNMADTGALDCFELEPLKPADGAKLFLRELFPSHKLGDGGDFLEGLAEFYGGHPLTLRIVAEYLKSRRGRTKAGESAAWTKAAYEIPGRDCSSVLTAFENQLLGNSSAAWKSEILRLMGLFESAAGEDSLECLLANARENQTSKFAESCAKLVQYKGSKELKALIAELGPRNPLITWGKSVIDAHQLVRTYAADRMRLDNNEGWKEGKRILGKFLEDYADNLQPTEKDDGFVTKVAIYQLAMRQYCAADQVDQAFEVYWGKIQNRRENKATNQYGIVAAEALEPFYDRPREANGVDWTRPVAGLKKLVNRARLGGAAASELWHAGRNREALTADDAAAADNYRLRNLGEPEQARDAHRRQAENLRKAAETACVIGATRVGLEFGDRSIAVSTMIARQDRKIAEGESDHENILAVCLATRARVRHLRGEWKLAEEDFQNAGKEEALRGIYALWHADLLIDRKAFVRAEQIVLECEKANRGGAVVLLDEAYIALLLGRLQIETKGHLPDASGPDEHFGRALEYAKRSHQEPHIALVMLMFVDNLIGHTLDRKNLETAVQLNARIAETLQLAHEIIHPKNSPEQDMLLYETDSRIVESRWALTQGRFLDFREHLAEAEKLVAKCGYGRREPEVERLRKIAKAFGPLLKMVSDLGQEAPLSYNIIDIIAYRQYTDFVNKHPDRKSPYEGVKDRRVHDEVVKLDAVEVRDRHGLRSEQVAELKERIGSMLRSHLPALLEEFGLESINGDKYVDRVWTLIETNIRAAHHRSALIGSIRALVHEFNEANMQRREALNELSKQLRSEDLKQLDRDERQNLVHVWNIAVSASWSYLRYVDNTDCEHEVLGFYLKTSTRNQKGYFLVKARGGSDIHQSMEWPNFHVISVLKADPSLLNPQANAKSAGSLPQNC